MKVMWLARLTGFHLLWTVTYLSSFCRNPSEHHHNALCQLLRFIVDKPIYGIRFSPLPNPKMGIMTDAAHGQHFTSGRGHYGIVMTFAGGYVCSRSSQIPMVTLSPMESEYYGMSEAITYAIWG